MAEPIRASTFGVENTAEDLDRRTELFDLTNISQFVPEKGFRGLNKKTLSKLMANEIGNQIASRFVDRVGRKPNHAEVAAIFNQFDFNNVTAIKNASLPTSSVEAIDSRGGGMGNIRLSGSSIDDFLNDPKGFITAAIPQHSFNDAISMLDDKFKLVDMAQNSLSQFGADLPQDVIARIVSAGVSPESASELANSYVKRVAESSVARELQSLPERQNKIFNQLDEELRRSQSQFFTSDLFPVIQKQLASRGLLNSGSLNESIASQTARLNREREGFIAPLRSTTALSTQSKKFENILRGALESGQSLSNAVGLAGNLLTQERNQQFLSGQSALNRQFQGQEADKERAFQLASTSIPEGPSALDYFLGYGLPTITNIATAGIKARGGR